MIAEFNRIESQYI